MKTNQPANQPTSSLMSIRMAHLCSTDTINNTSQVLNSSENKAKRLFLDIFNDTKT